MPKKVNEYAPRSADELRRCGRRSRECRSNPAQVRGMERHSWAQSFRPTFFLRAGRSDVSRLRHPVHRTDASAGRGTLNRQSCRPTSVTRIPPPPGGTQERAENLAPASGLQNSIRRVEVSGRSGGHRAFESQRRCRAVRLVNLRWTIALSRSTEVLESANASPTITVRPTQLAGMHVTVVHCTFKGAGWPTRRRRERSR